MIARLLGRMHRTEKMPCHKKHTYSQAGEDAILRFMFNSMKISHPRYLDIGANHPVELSNSFHFYTEGSSGVCVEANPTLADEFKEFRPRDTVLPVAITPTASGPLNFYVMSNHVLSTLDQLESERMCREEGESILDVIEVPTIKLNDLIDEQFDDTPPDFISLDVEGIDLAIIESFDFQRARPIAWCVETISYSASGKGKKELRHAEVFAENGYMHYADTYINSLFVDAQQWNDRHKTPSP